MIGNDTKKIHEFRRTDSALRIRSGPSRRPQASTDVRSKITAQDADFANVRVRPGDRLLQRGRQRDYVGDPMPGRDQFSIGVAVHFVKGSVLNI